MNTRANLVVLASVLSGGLSGCGAQGAGADGTKLTSATAAAGATAATGATGATGATAAATGATGATGAGTTPGLPPHVAPTLTKAEFAAAKKGQASFTRLLNEGRALSKAKNYAAAMAKFAEADKAAPGHPAGLGEHGWAAFKAGELELAESKTRLALASMNEPKRKAAVLYNLGRIEEALGNLAAARGHYARSLSLRDNKTVADRLAALPADAATAAGDPKDTAPADSKGESPDKVEDKAEDKAADKAEMEAQLEQLCEAAMQEWLCNEDDSDCRCTFDPQLAPGDSGAGVRGAALLTLNGHGGDGGDLDGSQHLAVQGPSGQWFDAGLVGYCHDPGVAYVQNDCAVEIDLGDHLDAPGSELIVTISNQTSDLNPGIGPYGEAEFSIDESWMLCRTVGKQLRCASLWRSSSQEVEALDPTLFEGEPLTPAEKAEADKQASASAWVLEIKLGRDGRVSVTAPPKVQDTTGTMRANELDASAKAIVGSWSIDDFEAHEGVEVIDFPAG